MEMADKEDGNGGESTCDAHLDWILGLECDVIMVIVNKFN